MNIAVRYFTRSGNTKKLADAIGAAVGSPALPITSPLTESADLLFLGGSVYGFGIDDALKHFIGQLSSDRVKEAAVFSTAAIVTSAYPHIKKLLDEKGIPVAEKEFHCRGKFTVMHRDRPNEKDLADAAAFAESLIRR
jgi:flavodoxin